MPKISYTVPTTVERVIPQHLHKMVCYLTKQAGKEPTQVAVELLVEGLAIDATHAAAIVDVIKQSQKEIFKFDFSATEQRVADSFNTVNG